jgi:hypothetical protein
MLCDLQAMAESLEPYVDGLVWLPSAAGLSDIRNPLLFRRGAEAMRAAATGRLLLIELPAFEDPDEAEWLNVVGAFVEGGGDGIVAVRGREVPRDQTPNPTTWPFPSAIQCGASLAAYRQKAILAARQAFPDLFIAACGGFHCRDEAFRACEYANVIAENEAYTRFGPGIVLKLLNQLVLRLRYLRRSGQIDSGGLWSYQQSLWQTQASPTDECSPHHSV